MNRINKLLFVILIILVVLLFYQSNKKPDLAVKNEPAKVEPITGSELNRLTLTNKAADRLDIQTEPVSEEWAERSGRGRKVVPYSSIIYDLNGDTWVYVNPEPLVFTRNPIIVDYIDDDKDYLSEGPIAGTDVVTVGVAELYGIDTGVGK